MAQQLKAAPYTARTKGEVKQLRRQGFIPVSIQHKGEETLHLQQEMNPLHDFIRHHGEAALLELTLEPDNRKETVLVHDIQRDPVTRKPLHVTFQKVVRGEKIKSHIPVVLHGKPEAVSDHIAIVDQPVTLVEIRCASEDLPEHLDVDISQLNLGEVVRVSDLTKNDKIEILTPPDTVLASLINIAKQTAEEELAAATEAADITEEPEEEAADKAA
jgi:large subunit ribosomal protein L25